MQRAYRRTFADRRSFSLADQMETRGPTCNRSCGGIWGQVCPVSSRRSFSLTEICIRHGTQLRATFHTRTYDIPCPLATVTRERGRHYPSTLGSALMHLPPELWSLVLEDIGPADLCAIHLLSWNFHDIAHPLLFRKVRIHLGPNTKDLAFLARLDALKSRDTRLCVRNLAIDCSLRPCLARAANHDGAQVGSVSRASDNELVVALLKTLPTFKSLRRLELVFGYDSAVHVGKLGLEKIHAGLEELVIDGGVIVPAMETTKSVSLLRVDRLVLHASRQRSRDSLTSHLCLMELVDPSRLRTVTLHFRGCLVLGSRLAALEFPAVTSLSVSCFRLSATQVLILACVFPNVEGLKLDVATWAADVGDSGERLFPRLRKLIAPEDCLPFLLSGAAALAPSCVARLTVNSDCMSWATLAKLDLSSLRALWCSITVAELSNCVHICEWLPALTVVELSISVDVIATEHLKRLASALARMVRQAKQLQRLVVTLKSAEDAMILFLAMYLLKRCIAEHDLGSSACLLDLRCA
ncbi:unnamed protein product [Mycena citricolor]|uniref:F-box domain-containing protein n=1 Tax=Mycena citricolor TaxID=2018698 RepID=A0AAD2K4G4_9AGAR|nr:unnamed protein product [Mycena citricolor]